MGLQLTLFRCSPLHRAGSKMNPCWCIESCPVAMPQPLNQARIRWVPPSTCHPMRTSPLAREPRHPGQHNSGSTVKARFTLARQH